MSETNVKMGETNVKMSETIVKIDETKVKMGESEMIVGIDLGTCNSSAAIIQGGKLQLIAFSECSRNEGQYVLPSYVSYDQKGDVAYVGGAARSQAPTNPKRTFYNIKRLIGKKYEEALNEAKTLNLSCDIVKGDDGYVKLKLENRTLYPYEVTAEILRQIKRDAENNLNKVINRAVITVPAYFDDDKRKYTRKAGEVAGLEVVHVLVEPAAALLTYSKIVGMEKMYPYLFSLGADYKQHLHGDTVSNELRSAFENNKCPLTSNAEISSSKIGNKWEIRDDKMIYEIKESGIQLKIYKSNPNIMVFDIGAGTLDIVIMSYKKVMGEEVILSQDTQPYDEDESPTKFEPLVYEGDSSLGGANMDAKIMDYVLKEIQKEHNDDLKNDSRLLIDLKERVEDAKVRLSKKPNTIISIDYKQDTFEVPLTREKLEELVSQDIDRCRNVIKRAIIQLKEKGFEKEEIDDIILVGGPTRMPIIQKMIEKEVGKPLRKIENINDWNPMTCVATGAAHWIDIYRGTGIQEVEKKVDIIHEGTPYAYGIINIDTNIFVKLIEKDTIYPTKGYYLIPLPKMTESAKIRVGQINPKYLFNWDEIPGNDNGGLIELISQDFGIDWVKMGKIEKIEDGKAIRVTNGKNSLSLRLNNDKTKIILEIDERRKVEFVVKNENGKLKIYNPNDAKDRVNLGEYEFRIVKSAKDREIEVIFELDHDGILSVIMTMENESLKFAGLVADESNRDIKITAVLSPDEDKAKKTEEEKHKLEQMKKEMQEEIKKLDPKQLDAMATQQMMNAANQKIGEAYNLAHDVLTSGTSVEDGNRISKKQDDLSKLYEDKDNIPLPQYYANADKLSKDLIEACEKAVITIPDGEVDRSIKKANQLKEKIKMYSGIHHDISEKISELEMAIGDPQLSNNIKFIRIERRIAEISYLLKKYKINI